MAGREIGLGVAWFDSSRVARDGLAFRGGEAWRFGSPTDLVSDTVWLTNLPYPVMKESGLSRSPRFRSSDYLRTSVRGVVGELGLAHAPPEVQGTAVLDVYTRIMAHARAQLDIRVPPRGTLPRGLQEWMHGGPESVLSVEAQYAIRAATQSFTVSAQPIDGRRRGRGGRDEAFVVLRRHRQTHVREILASPEPVGKWTRLVWADGLTGDAALERAEAIARDRPAVFRVRILGYHSDRVGEIHNHGAGARDHVTRGHKETNVREWVSTPEYLMLARHARLEILGVMAAEGWGDPLLARIPWSEGMEARLDGRESIAYPAGLWLECLAAAITHGKGPDPSAMWLLAMDRMHSFMAAMRAAAAAPKDISVAGYARGRVWLRLAGVSAEGVLNETQREALARLAVDADLTPPVLTPSPESGSPRDAIALEIGRDAGGDPGPADIERMAAILGRADLLGLGAGAVTPAADAA